jgi:hypothetical protein
MWQARFKRAEQEERENASQGGKQRRKWWGAKNEVVEDLRPQIKQK